MQRNIRNWLAPPEPWKNHHIACDSRHEGTTTWFIESDTFLEWKISGPSSLLWLHGKRELLPSVVTFADTNRFVVS